MRPMKFNMKWAKLAARGIRYLSFFLIVGKKKLKVKSEKFESLKVKGSKVRRFKGLNGLSEGLWEKQNKNIN